MVEFAGNVLGHLLPIQCHVSMLYNIKPGLTGQYLWCGLRKSGNNFLQAKSLLICLWTSNLFICVENVSKRSNLVEQMWYSLQGYTGKLQDLDVGINCPFKHLACEKYKQFMLQNECKPTQLNPVQWIDHAWERITEKSIINTWASIGITASLTSLEL